MQNAQHRKSWFRRIAWLMPCLFLFAQTFILLHTGAHGFTEHKHAGQICGIFLYSKQNNHADTPAAPTLTIPISVAFFTITPIAYLAETARAYAPSPRVPPAFS